VFDTQGAANLIYQNVSWDFRTYNLDRDVKVADDTVGRQLNAVDPNLKAFEKKGGKLILSHGWSDPLLSPMGTVDYYNSVVTKMGRKGAEGFSRLYMVPGMQHCYGGPGPNTFGGAMTAALERWVEDGVAPGAIIATKYKTDGDPASGVLRTRPLCPYPQVARYKGTGSTDEAANFTCKAP
jgi:feruloyl esterase